MELHNTITALELYLIYLLKDRDSVNRLLTLDAKPEVLRAVLLSIFELLAKENDVNFRPSVRQLASDKLARVRGIDVKDAGAPVSPEFSYDAWIVWFANQRKLKPRKKSKRKPPKPAMKRADNFRQRVQPGILAPNPAAPAGYRLVLIGGRYYLEKI